MRRLLPICSLQGAGMGGKLARLLLLSGLKNDVAKMKLLPLLLRRRGQGRGGLSVGFRAAAVFMQML